MVLNEEQWIKELREKRIAYGISQGRLAVASGITREYLNKIESGKMKPSKELLNTLHKELAKFNPEAPLTMLFDYVKIRFPTLDIQHIIKDILKLNINYMLHENYGRYSYTEHYSLGDIFIYTSADEEKGVLLELKGRGCRQFESYLLAWLTPHQQRLVRGRHLCAGPHRRGAGGRELCQRAGLLRQ